MTYDKNSFLAGLRTGLALGRRVLVSLITKLIRANGIYRAENDGAAGYSVVTVDVPNSYTQTDEGKVVVSGALAAQTALTVTANGIYNTTENNSVTVNVSGGGSSILSGTGKPAATLGSNGQTYLQYFGDSWPPTGATALDYIESTGTQYINTGYLYKLNSRIIADILLTPGDYVNWPSVFGGRTNNLSSSSWLFVTRHVNYGRNAAYARGRSYSGENVGVPTPTGSRLKLVCENGFMQWSGDGITTVTHTVEYDSTTGQFPLFLFGVNMAGAFQNGTQCLMRLYRFSIYEGDALVQDFRPVLDGNGVACLYETVSGNYFYNAGTGSFTAGASLQYGTILAAYVKKNGAWINLIGANISDVG